MLDGDRFSRFDDVDASSDPTRLGAYLDALAQAGPVAASKRRRDRLLAFRGARVLDVGCGTGADARAMGRLVGPRGRAVGADTSETLLAQARARVEPGDGPVTFVRADAAHLPFGGGSWDGVRAERTLQHVADPRAVVGELARVLVPGGRLVAVEPDWETVVIDLEPPSLARDVAKTLARAVRHPRVGRTLGRLFADAGLLEVEIRAEAHVILDPRRLGAADPTTRIDELVAAGGAGRKLVDAVARAADSGRFLAAVTVFEAAARTGDAVTPAR